MLLYFKFCYCYRDLNQVKARIHIIRFTSVTWVYNPKIS